MVCIFSEIYSVTILKVVSTTTYHLLHLNLLLLIILKGGPLTGRHKDNPGVLNQRLTRNVNKNLLSDVPLSQIFNKVSTRSKILN
jgi:hypothetical protein